MKRSLVVLALCLLSLLVEPAGYAAAASDRAVTYYVSLGDSLAAGTQPGQLFTAEGYADQLAALLRAARPTLRLVKLGCPGETTASMIDPDLPFEGRGARFACDYPRGSQLAEALNFLHAHRGFVKLVTLDIGPNDVFRGGGVPAIQANLPGILAALRQAAGPAVPIVGMNFYDPFIAPVWFSDPSALPAEVASAVGFNSLIGGDYALAGMPVADVGTAFSLADTTLVGGVPLDVLRVCAWTWICSPAHDIHPNAVGYGVIARAFLPLLP